MTNGLGNCTADRHRPLHTIPATAAQSQSVLRTYTVVTFM